jgi:hypothetical protein
MRRAFSRDANPVRRNCHSREKHDPDRACCEFKKGAFI